MGIINFIGWTLVSLSYANNNNCELIHSVSFDEQQKTLCALKNPQSCTKPVSTVNYREKITQIVNDVESNNAENKKNFAALNNPKKSFYREEFNQETYKQEPMNIFDWFLKVDPSVDRNALKNEFIDQYEQYAEQHDCSPVITTGVAQQYLFSSETFKTEEDAKKYVASHEESAKNILTNTRGQAAIEKLNVCYPTVNYKIDKAEVYSISDCSSNITHFFGDNVWDYSQGDLSKLTGSSAELKTCIEERKKIGATIHHIRIVTSSSTLNNTGKAAEKFGEKSFKCLSEARAETTKNNILPLILGPEANYPVTLDTTGKNGDGTSGDCAYQLVNGKEVMKSYYQKSKTHREELDENKFVKIVVSFNQSLQQKKVPAHAVPYRNCNKIRFSCPK